MANTTRAARAVSAGTAKSLIWSTRPCGIAACWALAIFVAEWTISSRRPGSVTLVGSGASIADTLLPSAPLLAGSRTDTGIIAISGWSGSASWSMSQRRSAPAHIAITTSLTDTPKAFFTILTVSRSTLRKANRRCGVMDRLNGVAGARPGRVAITVPSPRFSPSMLPTRAFTAGARVGITLTSSLVIRAVCTGRQASRARPRPPGAEGAAGSGLERLGRGAVRGLLA